MNELNQNENSKKYIGEFETNSEEVSLDFFKFLYVIFRNQIILIQLAKR